jgi:type IV pilus assembly protein PilA
VIIGILAAIAIPKFANTKSKAYIAAMKSDLRNLVTAEESFFADSTKYVTYDTSKLKFKPSTGVNDPVIVPGSGFWSATITHTQIASFSCGIGVNTANPIVSTAGDGEPACK